MSWRGTKGSARPAAWQASGQARQALAAVLSNRRAHDTTNEAFYNARGQVVGKVLGGWLVKHVETGKHMLLKPPAWAVDRDHLDRLDAMGAVGVLLIDEHGTEWRATVGAFLQFGLPLNRGHGAQVALPLARWRKSVAGQLSLFGEVA